MTDSPDLANRIDAICDQFEQQWRTCGTRPTVDQFLTLLPKSDQPQLLAELQALERDLLCQCEDSTQLFPATVAAENGEPAHVEEPNTPRESFAWTSQFSVGEVLRQEAPAALLPAEMRELHRLAYERDFKTGEYLIRQGELATSLIVIRRGKVKIIVEHGPVAARVIDCSGPGEILGEMALLTNEPRTASAVAMEPVKAAILEAEDFYRLTRDHPYLSMLLNELIAKRLGSKRYDALSGKLLDGYQIERRLGLGGMSVVYEAVDTRNRSHVALKMLSHRLVCSTDARSRFQYEADLIERFDHPNIVKMLRRFSAFNTYFIVMEFCEGETLAKVLKKTGPMQAGAMRRNLGQVAQALDYAHREGVSHRDVKPANIMCLGDGSLKLMDFGLAEPCAASDSVGTIIGTPRYMAPEQRAGRQVDHRADCFALGCVAYEMLTGTPLFRASESEELMRDFAAWQPPDFTQFGKLDGESARTLGRLLAVQPERREHELTSIAKWAL